MARSESDIVQDLVNKWISLGVEYGEAAPGIKTLYVYAASESGIMHANVFYEQDGKVVYPDKLEGEGIDHDDVFKLQTLLLEDLEEAEAEFIESGVPCPTEYKITYETGPSRLDVQLSRDIKFSNDRDRIPEDGPEEWLDGRLPKVYGKTTPPQAKWSPKSWFG
ncbi:hypothetical protein [Clavibacter tessellarius]|uniref:hypothetical protein n=1 Tax=Clavibacter TaxID=1573 RepID=UPI000A8DF7AF|nr:hypothetical protein [Clavibacter michiganensis]